MIERIGSLGDLSRFIMHRRLRGDKRSDTCTAVLADAFQLWAHPCVLGSDNGGEFTGAAFTNLLREHGMTAWRTVPHTAEHNGKMERLWRTLERARVEGCTEKLMAVIIQEYTTTLEHGALGMTRESARAARIN
jgi:transposase InsO family protein